VKLHALLLLLLATLCVACGSDPNDGPPDYWIPPDNSGDFDVRPEDTTSAPTDVLSTCRAACEARDVQGGCIPTDDGTCDGVCAEAGLAAPQYLDHVLGCVARDPLCFQSMSQCVLSSVYPAPFEHVVTLNGSGYEEWVGLTVFAGVEESQDEFEYGQAIIEPDGTFRVEILVNMWATASHLTLFWIDLDAESDCDSESEPTGSVSYELGAPGEPFVDPDWVLEVSPEDTPDAPFACEFL
jgi:hypothetical protein